MRRWDDAEMLRRKVLSRKDTVMLRRQEAKTLNAKMPMHQCQDANTQRCKAT
jgi:hypothetical protein